MKKVLFAVIGIALVIWIISWFRTPEAVATSGAKSWPGGLGTLESVAARLPEMQANDASKKLTTLANALPKNEAIDEFVAREIARGELTIGAPPSLPDVAPMRELLLREPIVWARPAGVGEIGDQATSANRVVQMTTARVLVASALAKAGANDPTAWEDLRAVWQLARSLEPQPQMMTQTAALSMVRMINGAAWKLPLPAPAWLGEMQQRDDVHRLIESFQYQVASYWESGASMFPTKSLADSVEKDRGIADALFVEKKCDVSTKMNDLGTDLSSVWRRAFRYRAEREATANALRIREGKPIEQTSRCSDGTWSYDGTTLRFSHDIKTAAPDRPMPLVLKVRP